MVDTYAPARPAPIAPCDPWPTIETCDRPDHLQPTADNVAKGLDNATWLQMVEAASQILWAATGRRFGTCTTIERPQCAPCGCACACVDDCGDMLHGQEYLKLTRRPVAEIRRIVIDGVPLRLDQFAVANHGYVLRLDGGCWPECQDYSVPPDLVPQFRQYAAPQAAPYFRWAVSDVKAPPGFDGIEGCSGVQMPVPMLVPERVAAGPFDPNAFNPAFQPNAPLPLPMPADGEWVFPSAGSWYVEYSYGKQVPHLGQMAVAELARELGKACAGDKDCQLPKRVQTISRQGVSMTMIDELSHLQRGLWGLTLVDQFITTYNPRRLQRSARIFRADRDACDRPPPLRVPADTRVLPPREQLFGRGNPMEAGTPIPNRTDGLAAQPGDLYLDTASPERKVYELLGIQHYVAPQGAPFDRDEQVWDDEDHANKRGDGIQGPNPTVHARRPGDAQYDFDTATLYEWRPAGGNP